MATRREEHSSPERLSSLPTDHLGAWLGPQRWKRDSEGPCLSLGLPGSFDDMHIFAPCVTFERGGYLMWYCGSQGVVADRVFGLGLAKSADGIHFARHAASPVLAVPGGRRSLLTPALLRHPDGSVLRENGRLRLWFASADLGLAHGPFWLHEATSEDGVSWTEPSEPQLDGIYSPTVIREGDTYRMWYTDVSADPWLFRHAESGDGRNWQVTVEPVLQVDQPWEHQEVFYPTVVKTKGLYLIWYGSYSEPGEAKTALGFAVSLDGIHWKKNPGNPVFGPDESRPWESHYTTSQSVMRVPGGWWRIWYASRCKPPFTHKYYAIGTATWPGPEEE